MDVEKGGVKMVLIQDGPQQTAHEKPLRISGDPAKVEFAKQMVIDLLAQKEMERGFSNGGGPPTQDEIMVPRQAVGVVIGKGGDMIKRIQQDSGARVQFVQGKEDLPGDKLCQITGTMEQVPKAASMIRDLIQSVMMGGGGPGGGMPMGGGGRGRGRGRGGMGGPGGMRPDFGPGGPRMGRPGGGEGGPEIQFAVPANKCGLVIGKGGETVRNINQQSGAHVEIARGAPPNPHEKIFIIRGNPQQIEHAKQLIMERVGGMAPGQGPPGGPGGPNQGGPGPQGQYPGPQYQQQYQQPGPGQPYAGMQPYGAGYQPWPNQPQPSGVPVPSNDPAKAAADANAAAWAAYYAQFYNQPGQSQPQPGQMPQAQPAAQPQAQPQNNVAVSTGQADYSAAWVEYYRSLGMFREADIIEQQARGGQAPGGQPTPQSAQPGAPMSQPGMAPQAASGATQPTPTGTPAAQPASANVAASGYPGAYPAPGQQPQPAQVPYGQPAPYPGYNYAATYGTQQPFPVAAPQ
ncbi:far upstream element-binding protein 1-like [Uloborus diversus]|uniref:far upstream element-binding protein 1-like n=1 Tax=Uloborus diversus TaxID=327109 RepID=UPI00240A6F65|nr:far upstream element-binding protein 1-like [Uloborus diversus]